MREKTVLEDQAVRNDQRLRLDRFGILLAWLAFFGGFVANLRRHLQEQNKKIKEAHEKIAIEIKERKHAQIEKDDLIVELKNALSKVKTLKVLWRLDPIWNY